MIERMFLSILNMSLAACLLITAVVVIRFIILHRIPRKFICILWAIVAVRLILPFSIESPFSLVPGAFPFQVSKTVVQNDAQDLEKPEQSGQQFQKPNSSAGVTSEEILQVHSGFAFLDTVTNEFLESRPLQVHVHRPTENSKEQEGVTGESDGENKVQEGSTNMSVSQSAENVIIEKSINMVANIWHILPFLWCIGTVVILLYAFYSYFRLGRKLKASIELEKGIFICDTIHVPFVFGLFAPKVYLPSTMKESAFAYVVEHEKMHLARKDYLWKAIGYLLLSIHWMNPLVWVSYILFCKDVELACDEGVIQDKSEEFKQAYAMTLFSCSVQGGSAGFLPLAFGEGSVKDRINSVMKYKKPTYIVLGAGVILCIVVALLFLTNPKGEEDSKTSPSQENMEASKQENSLNPDNSSDSRDPALEGILWWQEVLNKHRNPAYEEGQSHSMEYLPQEGAIVYNSWEEMQEAVNNELLEFVGQEGLSKESKQYYVNMNSELGSFDICMNRGEILVMNPDGTLTAYVKNTIVKAERISVSDKNQTELRIFVLGEKSPQKIGTVDSLGSAMDADIIGLDGQVGDGLFCDYFAEDLRQVNPDYYQMLLQPNTALKYYLNLQDGHTEWSLCDCDPLGYVLVTGTFQNGEVVHYLMGKDIYSPIWKMKALVENAPIYEYYVEWVNKRNAITNPGEVVGLKNITYTMEDLWNNMSKEPAISYNGYAILSKLEDEDTVLYGYWDPAVQYDVMVLRKGESIYPLKMRWANMHGVMPKLYKADYDNDGEMEFGILRLTGTGTGVSQKDFDIIDFSGEDFHENSFPWYEMFHNSISWKYDEEVHRLEFLDADGKEILIYEPKAETVSNVFFGDVNEIVLQNGRWYLNILGKISPYDSEEPGVWFTCPVSYDENGQFTLGDIVPMEESN